MLSNHFCSFEIQNAKCFLVFWFLSCVLGLDSCIIASELCFDLDGRHYVVWFMCVDSEGWRCQHRNAQQIHIIDEKEKKVQKNERKNYMIGKELLDATLHMQRSKEILTT